MAHQQWEVRNVLTLVYARRWPIFRRSTGFRLRLHRRDVLTSQIQGKSCFNWTAVDEACFEELVDLTQAVLG